MNYVSLTMAVFAMLGALDRIFGNRFGLGGQFEKGFHLFGSMALSMIGMILISPVIADILKPAAEWMYRALHIDPSVIPAVLFANDMGGAPLAKELAENESVGMFNALVVSSMMGCTISFTIPVSLEIVKPENHRFTLLGYLCGIVTIPIGCFVSGLICRIPVGMLLWDLLPLVLFSVLIACGLLFCPNVCVKIFQVFGKGMKILITAGLALGIWRFLTGMEILPGIDLLENGAAVCLNAAVVMSGAFPLMHLVSKALTKPLKAMGKRLSINETSAMGFVASLATSMTTYEMMNDMDDKGLTLNAAFAISAAFTFAGHLAFTMAFDAAYIFPVIAGKLTAGFTSLLAAAFVYRRNAN